MCNISGEENCTCIPEDPSEIFNITKKIQEVNKDIRKLGTLIHDPIFGSMDFSD